MSSSKNDFCALRLACPCVSDPKIGMPPTLFASKRVSGVRRPSQTHAEIVQKLCQKHVPQISFFLLFFAHFGDILGHLFFYKVFGVFFAIFQYLLVVFPVVFCRLLDSFLAAFTYIFDVILLPSDWPVLVVLCLGCRSSRSAMFFKQKMRGMFFVFFNLKVFSCFFVE